MAEPIIKVDNLSVLYNKGKSNEIKILHSISIEIYPREFVIFFGPSGCGKSTLLYSISGLQAPSDGNVYIKKKNLSQMTRQEKVSLHQVGIGMIFQAFYLIPSLTVIDNICLPKTFMGESPARRREEGIKLLHRFSIVEQANKFPYQLSGGQKQRVSIARSLINDPEIILADEPVGNLDSASSDNVMKILQDLNTIDNKTIILVTHNPDHLHMADRVIHLRDGKVTKIDVYKERVEYLGKSEGILLRKEELPDEMKVLMRTFKNLSVTQVGALMVPFKANQLISHILSDLNEEQINAASGFLKEFLFYNINSEQLEKNLNLEYFKGGAGWNKRKTRNFVKRVSEIARQAEIIKKGDIPSAANSISRYISELFKLNLSNEIMMRFESLIRQRIETKLDRQEFQKKIDAAAAKGGIGLNRLTAEKVSREMEIIMLVKFTE